MTIDLRNTNVIITGGTPGGIGSAMVEAFLNEGANVLFTYNNHSKTEEVIHFEKHLRGKYSGRVIGVHMDVTDFSQQQAMLKTSIEFFNGLPEILVNNAGIIDRNSFLDIPADKVAKVLKTNLEGPFLLSQKIAQLWIKDQEQRIKEGRAINESYQILFTGSISGKIPTGMTAYEVSKAGLKMLMKCIAFELSPQLRKFRCNVIAPGLIPTNLNKARWGSEAWNESVKAILSGHTGTKEAVANILIAVAKNPFMNGAYVPVDGGRSDNFLGPSIRAKL